MTAEEEVDKIFDGLGSILSNKDVIPAFLITVLLQILQSMLENKILPKEEIRKILVAGMDVVKQQERIQNEVMGIAARELIKDENENIDLSVKRIEDKITSAVLGTLDEERQRIKEKMKKKEEEAKKQ